MLGEDACGWVCVCNRLGNLQPRHELHCPAFRGYDRKAPAVWSQVPVTRGGRDGVRQPHSGSLLMHMQSPQLDLLTLSVPCRADADLYL
jgi:hypothetical protein